MAFHKARKEAIEENLSTKVINPTVGVDDDGTCMIDNNDFFSPMPVTDESAKYKTTTTAAAAAATATATATAVVTTPASTAAAATTATGSTLSELSTTATTECESMDLST